MEAGSFNTMPSLQLLFLNANLLRTLPVGVFSGISLSRLNLRNNHFLTLPVEGVLEHLTGLVQVCAGCVCWDNTPYSLSIRLIHYDIGGITL